MYKTSQADFAVSKLLSALLTFDTRKLFYAGCRTPVQPLESFPDKHVAEWTHTCCNPSAVLYSTVSRSAAVVCPSIKMGIL